MENKVKEPTYIEIVCEAKLNSTESKDTLSNILRKFLPGIIQEDKRFDGTYLLIRNSGIENLQIFGEWVRQLHFLDTVRERFIRSIVGSLTAIYFNRQAAAMERLALVDVNDNPPLGPIVLQIVSDNLEYVADQVLPRTWKGKELTAEQWEKIRKQQIIEKQKKQKTKQKKQDVNRKGRET